MVAIVILPLLASAEEFVSAYDSVSTQERILAQKKITQFLGIPIDGFMPDMIEKLKTKGFVEYSLFEPNALIGEFNGTKVIVRVITSNNKVYRICLQDYYYQDAEQIKIRYNMLYKQFMSNKKYLPELMSSPSMIPVDEDVAYQIRKKNKKYQALFYQVLFDEYIEVFEQNKRGDGDEYGFQYLENHCVWFQIHENEGKYGIVMFYDNGYNYTGANGEDL